MEPEAGKIRITADDLERVAVPGPAAAAQSFGSIAETAPASLAGMESGASVLMNAWCYLGLAGFAGATLAWGMCEPWFRDGGPETWANVILFPLMVVLMCVGFGIAESIVERSPKKAVIRGAMSLALGAVLGFFLYFVANIIFHIGLAVAGAVRQESPSLWLARSIAWMSFGVAGGIVYGIVGQSGKRCLYGILGGVIGAGVGGFVFDPISIVTGGAALSRGFGMALFGGATGVAMGLVESALKDRWLYVAAGPLAGKQFILYKPLTTIGSDQSCDIYLFKDATIAPQHAVLELRGPRVVVHASGPVAVDGRAVRSAVLGSGNTIQIGRYAFSYRDRERTA